MSTVQFPHREEFHQCMERKLPKGAGTLARFARHHFSGKKMSHDQIARKANEVIESSAEQDPCKNENCTEVIRQMPTRYLELIQALTACSKV